MPNLRIIRKERVRATARQLFNRFYGLFGLLLTSVLFVVCCICVSSHIGYLPGFLAAFAGTPLVWGACYGAWVKRLTWAWCLITTIGIVGSLILGFALLETGPAAVTAPLMAGAFGCAGGIFLAWLAMMGIKLCNFENQ